MPTKNETIDSLWGYSANGTEREDIEAAYEAGRSAAITESIERGWIGNQYADDYRAAMRSTEEPNVVSAAPASPLSPEYKEDQRAMNKAASDRLSAIHQRVPFAYYDPSAKSFHKGKDDGERGATLWPLFREVPDA